MVIEFGERERESLERGIVKGLKLNE